MRTRHLSLAQFVEGPRMMHCTLVPGRKRTLLHSTVHLVKDLIIFQLSFWPINWPWLPFWVNSTRNVQCQCINYQWPLETRRTSWWTWGVLHCCVSPLSALRPDILHSTDCHTGRGGNTLCSIDFFRSSRDWKSIFSTAKHLRSQRSQNWYLLF